jgi:hypothetical protein
MVEYRKPPRPSVNLSDRRGNTPTETRLRVAAQLKKKMEEWEQAMEREWKTQLRQATILRASRGGRMRYWGSRKDTLGGRPLGPNR